jgi:DNA modification methylase
MRMLTQPGDLVLDIFAGSNTTGQVAESEGRRWLAFELSREYLVASAFRFLEAENTRRDMLDLHHRILAGQTVDLSDYLPQRDFLPNVVGG